MVSFQSPIHRGWVFNTVHHTAPPDYDNKFQSPIHRGWVFNLGEGRYAMGAITRFNPLFIGAGFLTCQGSDISVTLDSVSIPYSSGLGF